MIFSKIPTFFFILIIPVSISGQNILQDLILQNKALLSPAIQAPDKHEIQVIYTQIDRDKNNLPSFKTYEYRANTREYFYPASTVKMPAAFVALEKINQMGIKGLDKDSHIYHGVGSKPQTAVERDTSSSDGLPSVAHYIKKIFLVSDNDAFNRLYEFLGQRQLNEALKAKGFDHTRIIHRLGSGGGSFGPESNRYTNPISFHNGDSLLYYQNEVYSTFDWDFKLQKEIKGVAYMSNGKRINQAFNFSKKNYIALRDVHDMLRAVLFPEVLPPAKRFDLTEADYRFLYKWMSTTPRKANYPKYDEPDGYVKFFMYEGNAEKIPNHIKIFNKVGFAYGYLTDVAYIIDTKKNIEFMVAATIHVNANQTYNDNNYEYDEIGLPFLKNIGQILYDHECSRKRTFYPDLSKFVE